jgi:DNA-binding response OmpR family regulator
VIYYQERQLRILLVEDDDRVAAALRPALRRHGMSITRLSGGREVVAHLGDVDVVLLDLGLPDVDGVDVCRTIRETCDVPIIIVSARGEVDDRILGLHSGADDYLVKPYDVGELSRKEFQVLALLATAGGAVCTRNRIVAEVWGRSWPGANRTLDVHVATLRTKLRRPELVQTVRGVGYRLGLPAAGE